MPSYSRVAVTSRSFSRHPVLREETLKRFKNVTFNEAGKSLRDGELVEHLKGHDGAITALEPITEALLSELPELKAIGKVGVGIDMLDLDAMDRHGVRLGWKGGTNSRSVSELALALILSMLRHVGPASEALRSGVFKQRKGGTLSGKTVGLLGCGHVGKDLARLLAPFGCRLLCFDKRPDAEFNSAHGISPVGLEELLKKADIVSVHLARNEHTLNILSAERLSLMKPGACLVNTARGGLIDEDALKSALKDGRIAGAALDVFAEEPPKDEELIRLPNLLPTPHIAGSTEEAIVAMGMAAIDGLENPRPAKEYKDVGK